MPALCSTEHAQCSQVSSQAAEPQRQRVLWAQQLAQESKAAFYVEIEMKGSLIELLLSAKHRAVQRGMLSIHV